MLSLSAFQVICCAQSIDIFNSKSKSELLTTDFLEVGVKLNHNLKCCDYIKFTGTYISSTTDSIKFDFTKSIIHQDLNSLSAEYLFEYINDEPFKVIAKDDIVYITNFKSQDKRKFKKNMQVVGAALMLGGLVTTANSLLIADNNKDKLIVTGLAQFTIGITLGVSSNERRKMFKATNDPWRFK